jgi:hypothetical protein
MITKKEPLPKKFRNLRIIIIILCLIVFAISLPQLALKINDYNGPVDMHSYELFLVGGIAFLGGGIIETIIWLANPLSLIAIIIFFKSDEICKVFSIASLMVALIYTFWKKVLVAENGRMGDIEKLCSGYWLWITSIMILNIGIFYYFWLYKKHKKHAV